MTPKLIKVVFYHTLGVYLLLQITICQSINYQNMPVQIKEFSPAYWENLARERLQKSTTLFHSTYKGAKQAKNVIFFLGDGMGLPTIAAGRFFKAEKEKRLGQAINFEFESWPFNSLCRTYDLMCMVTDSASSSTAFFTGVKTKTTVLGLTGNVNIKQCVEYSDEYKMISSLTAASKAGKATGIVTTSRVTHASPAGAYAFSTFRKWEDDGKLRKDCGSQAFKFKDIAKQLIFDNSNINVILGGGQQHFYSNETQLPSKSGVYGKRLDGLNLPELWLTNHSNLEHRAQYIKSSKEFMNANFKNTDYLLGLLEPSHLPFSIDKKSDEPSLTNLTTTAIKLLQKNKNGFFLFVEAAKIDLAHHSNLAKKSMMDMLAFDETIKAAMKLVNLEDTLVVVTADHSHSFGLTGQPSRMKSLFDLDDIYGKQLTTDGKGMIPVSYFNGPSASTGSRINMTALSTNARHDSKFRVPSLIPMPYSSHGGEDVGVYAIGPFSWLYHSTIDNTFLAHSMKFAMCVEPYKTEPHCSSSSNKLFFPILYLPLTLMYACLCY